jgi:hypothetical protein
LVSCTSETRQFNWEVDCSRSWRNCVLNTFSLHRLRFEHYSRTFYPLMYPTSRNRQGSYPANKETTSLCLLFQYQECYLKQAWNCFHCLAYEQRWFRRNRTCVRRNMCDIGVSVWSHGKRMTPVIMLTRVAHHTPNRNRVISFSV